MIHQAPYILLCDFVRSEMLLTPYPRPYLFMRHAQFKAVHRRFCRDEGQCLVVDIVEPVRTRGFIARYQYLPSYG